MRDFFKVVRMFPGKNDLKIVGIFILTFLAFRFFASSDVGIQLCNQNDIQIKEHFKLFNYGKQSNFNRKCRSRSGSKKT